VPELAVCDPIGRYGRSGPGQNRQVPRLSFSKAQEIGVSGSQTNAFPGVAAQFDALDSALGPEIDFQPVE
jgi:hypothetical protein